jgi:hypothetical protein
MLIIRVHDGVAVEIVAFQPVELTDVGGAVRQSTIEDHYPAGFLANCVEYEGAVGPGWVLQGDTFVPPAGKPLSEIKTDLLAEVSAARTASTNAIGAANEPAHIAKWELCLRHDNGDATATTLLQPESTARGVSVDDFCQTVEAARTAYYQALMHIEAAAVTAETAVSTALDEATARAALVGFVAGIAT